MPLRYGLIPNHLTDDPDDYRGVVADNDTVTIEQIVEQMIGKGSTVTKAEALSVIEEYHNAVALAVANGNNVNTDLFKIKPGISGVFTDSNDGFDRSRHNIRINLTAGNRLTAMIPEIEVRKVEIKSAKPFIQQFINLESKAINKTFSPGKIAMIKGKLLKFNEEDESQGIFFISTEGDETRVVNIVKNKPSELMFFVPQTLTEGVYQIEIRAILHKVKTLRTGRLLDNLTPIS